MKKEEILAYSRRENKNRDPAELEIVRYSGSIAGGVGAFVCAVISLLASTLAGIMLYSPWVIYFSMAGTSWLVRAIKHKRKTSEWILAAWFVVLSVFAWVGLIGRLMEGAL